ncbi:hypothetical protein GCM10017687_26600 [Streptomyces echinatus]|uniref:hypothetical protein n=1 Tax=Streptomyces echinatus TaxID=67293 RepID=UPI0031F09255
MRLQNLINTADDAFRKAVKVDWQSEARDLYVKRLKEAKELTDALSEALRTVSTTLATYSEAVTTAKSHYKSGKVTEKKLSEVMSREATRDHTDGAAFRSLPDFQSPIKDPGQFLKSLGPLLTEAHQASDNPYAQLPGAGPKVDVIPTMGGNVVANEILSRIEARIDGLPKAQGNNYWMCPTTTTSVVSTSPPTVTSSGPPHTMPASRPRWSPASPGRRSRVTLGRIDDAAFEGRKILPGQEDPDDTSTGPLSIQVRRAAEVLGYDPHHLTDMQRDVVVGATKDPSKNIFIASEYLARLKAESGFADVPPEQMTRAQMQELAARYNGGPCYEDPNAQGYGRGFDRKLDDAKEALR